MLRSAELKAIAAELGLPVIEIKLSKAKKGSLLGFPLVAPIAPVVPQQDPYDALARRWEANEEF